MGGLNPRLVTVAHCARLSGLSVGTMLRQLKRMDQAAGGGLMWHHKSRGRWVVDLDALVLRSGKAAETDAELERLVARIEVVEERQEALRDKHLELRSETRKRLHLVEQKQRALAEIQEAHRKLLMLG